jgi:predicted glycosyltransferase
MRRRILFHVQHLLGIGHWRRAATLARALQHGGFDVTILSGGPPEALAAAEPFALVQLPPAQAADAGFTTIVDAAGRPIDDAFRAERRRRVLAAFDEIRPHILLIESFPFGRRAFRFELLPLIDAAKAATPRVAIVASVRDVLVAKDDPRRATEIVATVEHEFDRVLVHGDAALIPLEASFPAAIRLAGKLLYTGYVGEHAAAQAPAAGTAGTGEVIVSAGGGAVGMALFRAALAARPLSPLAGATWRLLTGPHLPPADYAALAAMAPDGVVIERFRGDFPELLRGCTLSISQGGYNTTLDILAARARAIVVPFAAGRETEQAMRAELLARRGAWHVLSEAELTGPHLAAAIARALAAPAPVMPDVQRDGAIRTARFLAALADSMER